MIFPGTINESAGQSELQPQVRLHLRMHPGELATIQEGGLGRASVVNLLLLAPPHIDRIARHRGLEALEQRHRGLVWSDLTELELHHRSDILLRR